MKKLTVVKLGSDDCPVFDEDINKIISDIALLKDKTKAIVCRYNIEVNHITLQENQHLLVNLGNEDRPASDDDIIELQTTLDKFFESDDESSILVTHHAVNFFKI